VGLAAMALAGYLAGAGVYYLQMEVFGF